MKERPRYKQGFTLIEVVVVMAIIAVLAVLVTVAINVARRTSRETTNRANARIIQTGMEAYIARNKTTPPATIDNDEAGTALPGGQTDSLDGTLWNAVSFEYIADNALNEFIPDGSLNPTPWCNYENGYGKGGGMLNIYRNGSYTIRPYNADCGDEGMETSAIVLH